MPETSIWLIRQGRIRQAKQISLHMYNDGLDMLADDRDPVERRGQSRAMNGKCPGQGTE